MLKVQLPAPSVVVVPIKCSPSYRLTTDKDSAVPETVGVAVLFSKFVPVMTGASGRDVSIVTPKPALKLLALPALSVTNARRVYELSASAETVIDQLPLTTWEVPIN